MKFCRSADVAVAPLVVEVADEGRAIGRREDGVAAADDDVAFRVAGMLGVARRRQRQLLEQQLARDAHPLVADVGASLAPQRQRRFVAEIDADLLEDGHELLMDQLNSGRVEQLVKRDLAGDEPLLDQRRAGAGRAPCFRPTPPPMFDRRCHRLPRLP